MSSNSAISTIGITAVLLAQVTAQPIWAYSTFNQISVCTNLNNSVVLPGAVTGSTTGNSALPILNLPIVIRNDGVSACNVWPQTGAQIDGLLPNTAFSVPAGEIATFTASSLTQWFASVVSSAGLPISAGMVALIGGAQPALAANIIPVNQVLTLIGQVATAKDSIALPDVPLLNQNYLVVNNGAQTVALWPGLGVAASLIDRQNANLPFFLGPSARCNFNAVSNVAGVIQWFSSGYIGGKANVPNTVAGTLTNQHGNCVISVTGTTYTIILPTLASANGLPITFNFTAGGTAVTIQNPGGAHTRGGISAGSAVHATIADVTNVICTTMAIGDTLTFLSDGTSYYVSGFIAVTGNVTTS